MAHGLSDKFMEALDGGALDWLVKRVREDHTLDLEIRTDQIDVYYRGGCLMHVKRTSEGFPAKFNEEYCCAGRRSLGSLPSDARMSEQWLAKLPLLKEEMNYCYATKKKGNEREYQQTIVRENNFDMALANSTDYFLCSMEYQDGPRRFDLVGVHWPSDPQSRKQTEDLALTLIEVKYGEGALGGESGLPEHCRDFVSVAQDGERLQRLCEEMSRVFQQNYDLGLIPGCKKPLQSISPAELQVVFVLANTDPQSGKLSEAIEKIDGDDLDQIPGGVWFGRASHFGYGLFHDQLQKLSEFKNDLERQRQLSRDLDSQFRGHCDRHGRTS
ncbi:MAG: hypothetical protein ACYTGF_04955 [Planctomycetota bacterium]|jgi:hypothetical protein